jgi:hypothetical protein
MRPGPLAGFLITVLLLAARAGVVHAGQSQTAGAIGAEEDASACGPTIVPADLEVELTGTYLAEAWNLNGSRERLAGGGVALWWGFGERLALLAEVQLIRVYQAPFRDTGVLGLTPLLQWRVHRTGPWTTFIEIGPGVSWSNRPVPANGTQFNFVTIVGTGFTREIRVRTRLVAGFRWFHLSNGGRLGSQRNPDIQAVGPYAGIRLAL